MNAQLMKLASRLLTADERGASLVEYALLVALIALVCLAAITFLGNSAGNSLSSSGSQLFP